MVLQSTEVLNIERLNLYVKIIRENFLDIPVYLKNEINKIYNLVLSQLGDEELEFENQ